MCDGPGGSDFLSDLRMGEKREQPGPAEDVPDQRRKDDPPDCLAYPDLPGEQQEKGFCTAGDHMGEVAECDRIGEQVP
jgi:hypothetical protein